MKQNADRAMRECKSIEKCFVVKRTGSSISMKNNRDLWWHNEMENSSKLCEPEEMDSEDPYLFYILLVQQVNQKVYYTLQVVT